MGGIYSGPNLAIVFTRAVPGGGKKEIKIRSTSSWPSLVTWN